MLTTEEIANRIRAAIPDAQVTVRDPMNDGRHFEATVVSPSFKGLSRVAQHQAVYAPLKDLIGTDALHALSLKTAAP